MKREVREEDADRLWWAAPTLNIGYNSPWTPFKKRGKLAGIMEKKDMVGGAHHTLALDFNRGKIIKIPPDPPLKKGKKSKGGNGHRA